MAIDVHAHLYPRAFMEAVASHGPTHGVSLRGDVPPTLCFVPERDRQKVLHENALRFLGLAK